MNKTNWAMVIIVTFVVAVIASVGTLAVTGNTITVASPSKFVRGGTEVYTKAEVDVSLNNLSYKLNSIDREYGHLLLNVIFQLERSNELNLTGFNKLKVECKDGYVPAQPLQACLSSLQWELNAHELCRNHCKDGKCGVNAFGVSDKCIIPKI